MPLALLRVKALTSAHQKTVLPLFFYSLEDNEYSSLHKHTPLWGGFAWWRSALRVILVNDLLLDHPDLKRAILSDVLLMLWGVLFS